MNINIATTAIMLIMDLVFPWVSITLLVRYVIANKVVVNKIAQKLMDIILHHALLKQNPKVTLLYA